MQQSFSCYVCSASFFNGGKYAKIHLGSVMRNTSRKSCAVLKCAEHASRSVAFLCFALVLYVSMLRHITQIFKTIISAASVYVIYLSIGPTTSHVQPRKTMTFIRFAVYRCCLVSFWRKASRFLAFTYASLRQYACEYARVLVVMEHLFKSFLVQHGLTLTHFERS